MSTDNSRSATQKDLDDLHRRFDEHYAERMDRIEKKLDELTNAVVSIARAEEKIVVLIEDTAEIKAAVNSHTNRLHELELDVSKNKSISRVCSTSFGLPSVRLPLYWSRWR